MVLRILPPILQLADLMQGVRGKERLGLRLHGSTRLTRSVSGINKTVLVSRHSLSCHECGVPFCSSTAATTAAIKVIVACHNENSLLQSHEGIFALVQQGEHRDSHSKATPCQRVQ